MRFRTLCFAVAALLAVATLTACRTNVGVAGTIDGSKVSESTISDYLTSNAQSIAITGSDQVQHQVSPRSFVLDILIRRAFFDKLLLAIPGGSTPTSGQLSTLRTQLLKGKTAHTYSTSNGVKGYSSSFESSLVDTQVLATLLNNAASQGVNINKLVSKLSFPVSVNPRYGSWNQKQLELSTGPDAGVPAFVSLQPTPSSGS